MLILVPAALPGRYLAIFSLVSRRYHQEIAKAGLWRNAGLRDFSEVLGQLRWTPTEKWKKLYKQIYTLESVYWVKDLSLIHI